ncbi:hypothetical protein ASD21_08700 [Caulobacter sp. Root1455]|uniref:hypothetical protein n=1 Tax=unclassified Caulobacter TaxID=2648921 RepID=UPI0006FD37DE|nr:MULTISPECIES: hypothetical protein [unclassified Caulobacter]KQY31120.1 hypothetical protein ASD38_07175 [Caulobacter sp. Root487D2Y]KQY95414.1 hypothetical protein ASD21_08700 [Caulobacter sp. Root1455]
MAAYDASYGTPAAARQGLLSSLSDKISGLFHKSPSSNHGADPYAPVPPADYALTPDAEGKITLAGYKVPVAIAVIGAGLVAALLINRRTRAPAIAAATTAWSFFGAKLAR